MSPSTGMDPEKFVFHLKGGHLVGLIIFVLACAGWAYELRTSVQYLSLRLDGLEGSPGIASRVSSVEQSNQVIKEQIAQMRSEITALRLQLEENKNEEHQQRREIAELLTRINTKLGGIK